MGCGKHPDKHLQSSAAPFCPRVYHPRTGRAPNRLIIRCPLNRRKVKLRLLKVVSALVPKDASVSELSEHIYVDWVLSDLIDEIIISPCADVNYEELVRDAINAKDPNL